MAFAIGGVAEAGTWKRRTFLVDRAFQIRFAILVAVLAALLAILVGVWLVQSHAQAMAGSSLDYAGRQLAEANFRALFTVFVGVSALFVVGTGFVGVLLTHRIAGPALLMRRYLRALSLGLYPRVRALRSGDELNELFLTVTDAIEKVRRRDAEQIELLEEALEVMRGAVGRVPELVDVVARLEAMVADRRASLEVAGAAGRSART
jgi:hypothetical protein